MTTPTKETDGRLTRLNPKQEKPETTGSEGPPRAGESKRTAEGSGDADLFEVVPELASTYRKVLDARMERKAHAGSESWAFYAGMETAAMETAMWKAIKLLASERQR